LKIHFTQARKLNQGLWPDASRRHLGMGKSVFFQPLDALQQADDGPGPNQQ
jgi:hypothetical protein